MNKLTILFAAVLAASPAFAHSGKGHSSGGHHGSYSPSPSPNPAPSPTPSPSPAPSPNPGPSPAPSPVQSTGGGATSSSTSCSAGHPLTWNCPPPTPPVIETLVIEQPVRVVEVPGPERIVEKRVEVPIYIERTENVCPPATTPAPKPNPLRKPPAKGCK